MHRTLVVLVMVGVAGCFERSLDVADPCTQSRQGLLYSDTLIDNVDLLVVVQNTRSMADRSASVSAAIERMIAMLAAGDRDGDGERDFNPPRSLHVGVVSSDMGALDVTGVATCDPGFGDDGRMRPRTLPSCLTNDGEPDATGLFDFEATGTTADAARAIPFAHDVACFATPFEGCEYPQGMEAALKAISPTPTGTGDSPVPWTRFDYRPPTFAFGTHGHGDALASDGAFLRPDAVLAIVMIGDRDDCSMASTDVLSSSEDPSVRCHARTDDLQPIARFVDGLVGLHPSPAMLVYAAITGIPTALSGMDPTAILASPAMDAHVDPTTQRLAPACGTAEPGVRMTQLAQALDAAGASASVRSICDDDFAPALDGVVTAISEAIDGNCLPRALEPDVDGFVDCDVDEVLPPGEHCDTSEALELVREEIIEPSDGTTIRREVCRVRQVGHAGAGIEAGWAYDDGDARFTSGWSHRPAGCAQLIHFSRFAPTLGAEIRTACEERLVPRTDAIVQVGDACDPATGRARLVDAACADGAAANGNPIRLSCDRFSGACAIRCARDEDCADAGLPSDRCDLRSALVYFDGTPPEGIVATDVRGVCQRPTCVSRL